jgi:hypothetical protein
MLATWGLATLLTLLCLGQLFVYGQYRVYRLFSVYLLVNMLQAVVLVLLYQNYGFASRSAWNLGWISQAFVVIARALAAAEICYLTLGNYKGVWALAARILTGCGALVATLALIFGRQGYQFAVLILEIGLEASIATGIVGLFLFARYYGIQILPATQRLGLGLGLLSCCKILNDVVVERFAKSYESTWNFASLLLFVGVLSIWVWGLRQPATLKLPEPRLTAAQTYENLMPQVNQRLEDLNDELSRLWRLESPKS